MHGGALTRHGSLREKIEDVGLVLRCKCPWRPQAEVHTVKREPELWRNTEKRALPPKSPSQDFKWARGEQGTSRGASWRGRSRIERFIRYHLPVITPGGGGGRFVGGQN